jgi:SAM-dependent MidA family methyltransferase
MTPLEDLLIRRIAATGPINLADYMQECLLHPVHGYYPTRDPFGAAGDFITSPEISQMFGELLGLCLAQAWLDQGMPSPFALVELGPGRGTLMADLLRATRGVPGFHAAARIVLIEASAALRARQASHLGPYPVRWVDDFADLPKGPLFLVANEFFDALPVRQFTRTDGGWCETVVGLQGDGLALGQIGPFPVPALDHRLSDTRIGDIVELCPQAAPLMAEMAARIAVKGGLALIVDYGNWGSLGDTVQAMRAHRHTPILATPGQADLTAHVDFRALAAAAAGCSARFTTQGQLLANLGIHARAARLAATLSGAALEAHQAATRRLTGTTEMGSLFKALAIHAVNAPSPPGFD